MTYTNPDSVKPMMKDKDCNGGLTASVLRLGATFDHAVM